MLHFLVWLRRGAGDDITAEGGDCFVKYKRHKDDLKVHRKKIPPRRRKFKTQREGVIDDVRLSKRQVGEHEIGAEWKDEIWKEKTLKGQLRDGKVVATW